MREASAKCVDKYVASIQDRLRNTLWEVQAQSMVEACQQKQYYNRKIATVNLKPGDLVLVKADAFKGKRKIKYRWEEDTGGASDKDRCPPLQSDKPKKWNIMCPTLKQLIVSEVGIPLCIGVHHARDRCTSPTPCKTTSMGCEMKMMPQENNGKVVTQ